jgi:hypothetical protein
LGNVTLETYLDGVPQEWAIGGGLLQLDALGLFANPKEGFVYFHTARPFNSVRLNVASLASVSTTLNVYGACVSQQ